MQEVAKLTRNQGVVLGILRAGGGAMTAYEVLEAARASGFSAPPQVYRALDKLVGLGLVHRLESRNRFIACHREHESAGQPVAFLICRSCDRVLEIAAADVERQMRGKAAGVDFALAALHVEAIGECRECRAPGGRAGRA